ncbi:hypothetical protein E5F05_06880 [Deinococcus metallilatus]|uniref:RNase H-like HicB family nuclease n=1 Tax=Deinococcus metallilatus TaxID=1211322 RepID=A0AAJ5K655_9DEIO|nr:hypothetical protein [Deinococcus metallilatus]MBB5294670.1 putative RNase H-like HicB family nuclease [Deinococcus metallilatus]QBY07705.1 hypothetical protein E5F05_06880 [Deinococcus metallilatus]RXJ14121.1 hypothetical protein ERJ73_05715 [Deinococcus metallilatus]TLK30086.1 hypothetical protein FCS05_06030 [Deinococcus metallilatus]GMA15886.1 hypothetical protein GCM10025871_22170 [Deinococcus metallilatus]
MNEEQRHALNSRYAADLTELPDGRWQASFPDFPGPTITRPSREDLETALPERLRDRITRLIVDREALPTATSPAEHAILVQPAFPGWVEEPSEKYADFTKAEFDRVLASARLAEDRARQNGTYALAALPVLTFLRPATPDRLSFILYGLCLFTILALLVLTALAVSNRRLRVGLEPEALLRNREFVYDGFLSYREYLHRVQGIWINAITSLRAVRDTRFRLVGLQQAGLIFLALMVSVVIIRSLT